MPVTQAQFDAAREAGDANEYAALTVESEGYERALSNLAMAVVAELKVGHDAFQAKFPCRPGFLRDAYNIVKLMKVSDEGAE